jgi:hypothetical protein
MASYGERREEGRERGKEGEEEREGKKRKREGRSWQVWCTGRSLTLK